MIEEDGRIEGRNSVTEALRAERPISKLYTSKGSSDSALRHIISEARKAGIVVVEVDRRKLDAMSVSGAHQGVIAIASVKEYCTTADILEIAKERGESPFIVVCDELSDEHNLGAVIRTCEAAGVHGVIIPKRRSASLTTTIAKTSAGAVEHMAVARVPNIVAALEELKKNGVWIYGTAANGSADLWDTDLTGGVAIVVGSEGDGIRRLVKEKCDFIISIPMRGKISSLNVSASAAIVIYEALRQRRSEQ